MTPQEKAQSWLSDNAIILDTETTGLDFKAQIIEISMIDCKGAVLLDSLIRPIRRIPAEASAIHGITDDMVADAPAWPDILDEFEALIAERRLVIYNASYDLRLIRQTCERHNLRNRCNDLQASCAMLTYADYWGAPGRFANGGPAWQKLTDAAAQQHVITEGHAHRALADCRMTLGVIRAMAGKDQF